MEEFVTRERSRGIVGLFVLISALFIIFMIFAFVTVSNLKDTSDFSAQTITKNSKDDPIAVIKIEGAIMESQKIVELLQIAEEEKSVKAILLRIDSPGGAVAPTQEIYEEIRRIDKIKPIYSSLGSLAASGGYYIAAGTRKIYASAGTLTGSIGVIMQFADLSGIFAWAKVKPDLIKAGKYKDIGSPHRPMTDEERKLLSDSLAVTHKQFISHIVDVRKDRLKAEPEVFAQGQIFSGEEALGLGLIDDIAGMWEAGRRIAKEQKIKGHKSLRFIKKKREKFDISALLDDSEEVLSGLKEMVAKKSIPAYLAPF
jgi:protease IV